MTTATTEAPTSAYPSVCTWTQETEGSDYWGTSCGGVFAINSDTPSANCMKFCAYCGGVLVESLWVDEDDSAPDLFEQPPNYAAMEAEHMGDADKQTGIYAPHVVHQAPDPFGDPDALAIALEACATLDALDAEADKLKHITDDDTRSTLTDIVMRKREQLEQAA